MGEPAEVANILTCFYCKTPLIVPAPPIATSGDNPTWKIAASCRVCKAAYYGEVRVQHPPMISQEQIAKVMNTHS